MRWRNNRARKEDIMQGAARLQGENNRRGLNRRQRTEDDEESGAATAASNAFDGQQSNDGATSRRHVNYGMDVQDEVWTEADERAYNVVKDRLRNAHKFQLPFMHSPDLMMLLHLPPKVARARLFEMM